jgi:hypothetical protein
MMFDIELDLLLVGIILVPTHTKPIPKLVCIPNIVIAKPI